MRRVACCRPLFLHRPPSPHLQLRRRRLLVGAGSRHGRGVHGRRPAAAPSRHAADVAVEPAGRIPQAAGRRQKDRAEVRQCAEGGLLPWWWWWWHQAARGRRRQCVKCVPQQGAASGMVAQPLSPPARDGRRCPPCHGFGLRGLRGSRACTSSGGGGAMPAALQWHMMQLQQVLNPRPREGPRATTTPCVWGTLHRVVSSAQAASLHPCFVDLGTKPR